MDVLNSLGSHAHMTSYLLPYPMASKVTIFFLWGLKPIDEHSLFSSRRGLNITTVRFMAYSNSHRSLTSISSLRLETKILFRKNDFLFFSRSYFSKRFKTNDKERMKCNVCLPRRWLFCKNKETYSSSLRL
jgi:hypothetical protein